MKRLISTTRQLTFIIIIVFLFVACQKLVDYVVKKVKGDTEYRVCTIQQVTVTDPSSPAQKTHYTFWYNQLGNPVRVKNDAVGTGNPNMAFKYDKNNRLIELLRDYNNGFYETWHKYIYNQKNQIVRDTQYVFGEIGPSGPLPVENEFTLITYKYDSENRIIKNTYSFYSDGTLDFQFTQDYSYDVKGNRTDRSYDTKLSLLRTNKIWMFIARDYSLNNPFIATSYNEHKLPLSFSAEGLGGDFVPITGNFNVDYNCGPVPKAED